MKQQKLNLLFIGFAFLSVLAACHKDKNVQKSDKPTAERAGIYILNQGGYGDNNSTLTYYDYTTKSLVPDQFTFINGADKKIGDTGNDLGIYGSKMYIVVNNSNTLDIASAKNAALIKKDSIYQPRSVVFNKNHAFVTSYNGTVVVIDTATMNIVKTITVGRNPEQMVISNGKLYVANSGGLSFGNPDNTVSVINLTTLTETKKITVIADPVTMTADAFGHVYVLSLGNFADVKAGMTVIDNVADASIAETNPSLGYNIPIAALGNSVYYVTTDVNGASKIAVYNAKTQAVESDSFITDGTVITTPYAITTDSTTGEVFITDALDYASNGNLYAFDKNGKKEYVLQVGINPGRVTLVNK